MTWNLVGNSLTKLQAYQDAKDICVLVYSSFFQQDFGKHCRKPHELQRTAADGQLELWKKSCICLGV